MQMANVKNSGAAKVKGSYAYASGVTVLASCTATTFFSHEQEEPPAAAKPGQPAPAAAAPAAAPPAK
jgi:hypothetical protein